MKFHLRTLGCKMNLLDSARIAAALRRAGHEQVPRVQDADLVVVNSCTVTAESDRKSRQAARKAARHAPKVVVGGCGPRIDPARWQRLLPEAAVIGSDDELGLVLGIDVPTGPVLHTPRTRLPVPIQHGCDNTCAYCITRVARGPHQSEPLEPLVDHVRQAAALGVHEIVLTGINLAAWGCPTSRWPRESQLPHLLQTLIDRTPISRIRLSSLGPEYLGDAFYDVIVDPRICDHFHLSVQSGSPEVLARMERGHGVSEVQRAVERIRRARPNAAITADFIVGLPGESAQDFARSLDLVRAMRFAQLHVFPFSAREGTKAAAMAGQVAVGVKKARASELRALGRELRAEFLASQAGKRMLTLVEGDGTSLTSNFIRLLAAHEEPGSLVESVVDPHRIVELR